LYGDACGGGQDDADRLAVGVALLARAAAAPPPKGKVLASSSSPTVLPQAQCRVQKLYMHACMVDACDVGQDNANRLAVSVALLARAAGAPETPSEGQVLSPTVLPQAQRRVKKPYACMVMPVVVDRMTRTASLSASHSSPGLPPHHPQGARCCLRLVCRRLRVCRNCTCMLECLMLVVVDRMTRTAWLSASHSSPGLPARQTPRQRVRCCLRRFGEISVKRYMLECLCGDACDVG
jgi:hypothetical protein